MRPIVFNLYSKKGLEFHKGSFYDNKKKYSKFYFSCSVQQHINMFVYVLYGHESV